MCTFAIHRISQPQYFGVISCKLKEKEHCETFFTTSRFTAEGFTLQLTGSLDLSLVLLGRVIKFIKWKFVLAIKNCINIAFLMDRVQNLFLTHIRATETEASL